jgi:tape measure domain-containing protein
MSQRSVTIDIIGRDRASHAFNSSGRSADRAGGRMAAFGGTLKTAAATGVAALGAVAVAGVAMGIKTAAANQQSMISFETLLGSQRKAKAFMADLTSFASKTPFEMPGLVDAARQIIGVGGSAKSVIPTLTAWGDASGALGLSQEQFSRAMLARNQSMAKGKVQAEELMQITEAGIPVYPLLAKAMGKTVPELQAMGQKGQLLAKDVFPALEKQMHKDYGGSMAKQSTTLTGLWSTFTDTLSQGLAKAVGPLIPSLQRAMPVAINATSKALGWVTKAIVGGVDVVRSLRKNFSDLGGPIRDLAGRFMPWVKTTFLQAKTAFGSTDGTINTVKGTIKAILPVVGFLAKAIGTSLRSQIVVGAFAFSHIIIPAIKYVVKTMLWMVGITLHAAAKAFGWVPGIGPKLKNADRQFKAFARSVNNTLDGIDDETVNLTIRTVYKNYGGKSAAQSRYAAAGLIPKRASGGPAMGLTWVGEEGPELVDFRSRGRVITARDSARLASSGGSPVTINLSGVIGDKTAVLRWIREALLEAKRNGSLPQGLTV